MLTLQVVCLRAYRVMAYNCMTYSMIPAFFNLGTGEIIIIVFVILLLFGGRKIPELMKGLGKGVHSFKQGLEEAKAEMNKPVEQVARPEESEPKGKDRSE